MARSKSDQAFDERIAKNSEELRELLTDLYGEQAEEAFQNLTELMKASHAARPADLKRLDTKRLADPEWYKRGNMFGMTMYTDLFAGDRKKLAGKVPYLKEQKLTYLHLMPLLKMPHPQNDGGYAVEDFDTVDPSLGTNEDLSALTKKLRAAGISLCLDFVMNHTASSHRWPKPLKRAIRNIRTTTTATTTALFPTSTTPWCRKSSRPLPPATSPGTNRCTSGCSPRSTRSSGI